MSTRAERRISARRLAKRRRWIASLGIWDPVIPRRPTVPASFEIKLGYEAWEEMAWERYWDEQDEREAHEAALLDAYEEENRGWDESRWWADRAIGWIQHHVDRRVDPTRVGEAVLRALAW